MSQGVHLKYLDGMLKYAFALLKASCIRYCSLVLYRAVIGVHRACAVPLYASDIILRYMEGFPVCSFINATEKYHGIFQTL